MSKKMNYVFVISLLFSSLIINASNAGNLSSECLASSECPNVKAPLSLIRKRRHLSFPTGSNVVLTISLVKAFMVHAPSGWNLALEIDVPYPLPDSEFVQKSLRKKLHHRQKRQFWERVQNALDFQNINGRACIMRGVCEAQTRLAPPGESLVHDILRAIFTIPQDGSHSEFKEEMEPEYHVLLNEEFCKSYQYDKDCPVSILDFIFALNKHK